MKIITKHNLNKKNLFQDVWNNSKFNGKILKKNKWWGSDDLESFERDGHKRYKIDDINYEINEYGFRTSEDTNDIFKENTIACFGCSNTFGQGLPWDETWAQQLQKLMGDYWIAKNYGLCGASFNHISRLIYNYFLSNKAKVVCCFFPEILRLELFSNGNFYNFSPQGNPSVTDSDHKTYTEISSIENCLYGAIRDFKFIETLCELNNAKLYWFTWSEYIINLDNQEIDTLFNYQNFLSGIVDNADRLFEYPKARDGFHFGKDINKIIAENFYKKINEKNIK
jgi:hypothetical protein